MAANVRDSDTSLWLHNKLGTSSEWTSGSICSQLNQEVLRNIKDCFSDLQTQVKLKLLLSFFHIPRRLVEEWKTELEEVIEAATLDSELWVSMIAETIKTFPTTGSLNTEISDYEETRPIFIDMVNDLKKYVNKHSDLGMLPLECQYLNKMALTSVVGQQPPPVKHFTLKRKPKSATLRAELLQKSSDTQSSLKKSSAPTIPLRSRGMPRKMTDTTPLKGIPSRVPTSGFRSPTSSQNQNRPNMSRHTPAGRKDGGIKLLDIADQPLGYAAAKKRKRQQELEEQQKRALEAQSNPTVKAEPTTPVTTTPDYAAGLTATSVYTQPATPAPVTVKETPATTTTAATPTASTVTNSTPFIKTEFIKTEIVKSEITTQIVSTATPTIIQSPSTVVTAPQTPTANNNHIVFSIKSDGNVASSNLASSATNIVTVPNASVVHNTKAQGPRLIASTTIKPASSIVSTSTPQPTLLQTPKTIRTIVSSTPTTIPSLTAISNSLTAQQQLQQPLQIPNQIGATKIVQIKTAPTIQVVPSNIQRSTIQSIPPLVPTQQPTILNIQNVSMANRQTINVQSQSTAPSNISYITTTQQALQQQQQQQQQQQLQQQQQQQSQAIQLTSAPKFSQVVMSPSVKGKTIILANPSNVTPQKTIILRTVGPDGNTVFQQVPLSSVSGLSNISGNSNNIVLTSGPPGLVKTSVSSQQPQYQQIQTVVSQSQQLPALVPTSTYAPMVITSQNNHQLITGQPQTQTIHIQQQPQVQTQQQGRQVLITNNQGVNILPQGLTLIQRPGQQAQLVQTIQQPQQQIRTIIAAQPQQQQQQQQIRQPTQIVQIQTQPQQNQSQPIQIQQVIPQRSIITTTAQQPQQNQQIQRRGLTLSNEHVAKLNEIFSQANRVTRRDKALILGFMGGCRENPMPSPENYILIKLGENEERVKQEDGTISVMMVESLIKLDYNTGEWKKLQHIRRTDPPNQQNDNKKLSAQNSVVI